MKSSVEFRVLFSKFFVGQKPKERGKKSISMEQIPQWEDLTYKEKISAKYSY